MSDTDKSGGFKQLKRKATVIDIPTNEPRRNMDTRPKRRTPIISGRTQPLVLTNTKHDRARTERSNGQASRRTNKVKSLEDTTHFISPLCLTPSKAKPRSPTASTPTVKPLDSESSPQPDSRVTFVNAAHVARSRANNEIRQMDNVMEILSDHSSAEDETVASGHVKTSSSATDAFDNTKPCTAADTEPLLVLDSPSTHHADSSKSIARTVEGFAQPYRRPTFMSSPNTSQPGTSESIFDTVARSPVSSLKVVERMRPRSGSNGHAASSNGKGSAKSASSSHFSSAKAQSQIAEDFIKNLRSPVSSKPAASLQSPESKLKRSSRSSRRSTIAAPTRSKNSTPHKKMPLMGVQLGRYIQLAASLDGHAPKKILALAINYMQQELYICGLKGGDEHTGLKSSDIDCIEQRVNGNIAVIKVVPTDKMETMLGNGMFDPSSTDPNLREIYMVLHLTSEGDRAAITRLVSTFKESVKVSTLDKAVFARYAHEMTRPPSIDLTPSSDEEDVPKNNAASAAADSSTATTTLPYWSSITTDVEPGRTLPASQTHGSTDQEQNGLVASKPTVQPGLENKQRVREGTQVYGLRTVSAKPPVVYDDGNGDDDDFVPQCKEFCLTDRTLRFEYPRGGPKAISVTGSDISRLYEGEFLNDTILEFYIRYIDENLRAENPALHEKCFFFNTFFFRKLSQRNRPASTKLESDPMENVYRQLKRWTANVELFDKHYIFVPINENTHWYLAIIVNSKASLGDLNKAGVSPDPAEPPCEEQDVNISSREADADMALETDDRFFGYVPDAKRARNAAEQVNSDTIDLSNSDAHLDPEQLFSPQAQPQSLTISFAGKEFAVPVAKYMDPNDTPSIIILDSLGNRHQPTFGLLRGYMRAEARSRHGLELSSMPLIGKYAKMPLQNNFCDCGVYLLQYIEEFLKDPPTFMTLVLGGISLRGLFTSAQMQQKRMEMLYLATKLVNEQKIAEKTE
ncbi:hypothetical protein EV183_005034 [Coemansia sp. RSA 2336]|nr:hypothetical protein EV183_005034 [Coemansia sp. RSA 2336]